jgi:hypothetical protein
MIKYIVVMVFLMGVFVFIGMFWPIAKSRLRERKLRESRRRMRRH